MYIVKVPGINGLGKTNGCQNAGDAILKSLDEIYTNEAGKEINVNNLDLEEIHLDNSNLESSNNLIYKNAFEVFETQPRVVFLGGDHSVSYSLTRAFFDYCENSEKEPCLIVFDAHADCMEPMKEPTHEEWLRALIENGFPVKNILLVGARNVDKTEMEFLTKHKIRMVSMNKLLENLQDTCEVIMEFANNKELYVSIDIDVIDPAFAQSVSYQEPGGLTSREFIYIIQRMNKMRNLRAVDIVEIDAKQDEKNNNLTVKLGAKILSELL
ncbi:MAG: arginase family protein [Nanoarchaeota archaeon]|nr:arginase family protein [Nanoarchaeota archaeon]MBU4116690.1 arginase family protein [Nanoarchaeota archaeon]